jgi:hypothetical protein
MNRKTGWLLTVLLLTSFKFAEAQQAMKMPPSVKLHWEDTSDNETGFRIYRITPKGKTKIAEVGANVTIYTDKGPVSKACYAVTAFNSAGESDPSNVGCVDDSPAAKSEALGGIGSSSVPSQLANRRKLCNVELSPRGLRLLSEVEQTFSKPVRDQSYKDKVLNAVALIGADGTPTIRCNPAHRDLNEEIIVHQLYHLKLRAAGFPTTDFKGIEPDISRWIDENLYDTIQHWIMYPYLRKLGYSPDAARKREAERVISENKFTDEPLPPSDIIYRYLRIALESSDPLLVDQFGAWYLQRGWAMHLKKAQSLVQYIKNTDPLTAEQAVQSLIELANVIFEPYLTFQIDHWEAKRLGSIDDRNVVIRALSRSSK